jgi:hypothetical protein
MSVSGIMGSAEVGLNVALTLNVTSVKSVPSKELKLVCRTEVIEKLTLSAMVGDANARPK